MHFMENRPPRLHRKKKATQSNNLQKPDVSPR